MHKCRNWIAATVIVTVISLISIGCEEDNKAKKASTGATVEFTVRDGKGDPIGSVEIFIGDATTATTTTAEDGSATIDLEGGDTIRMEKTDYVTTSIRHSNWNNASNVYYWLPAQSDGIGTISGTLSGIDTSLLDDFGLLASTGEWFYGVSDFSQTTPTSSTETYYFDALVGSNTVLVVPTDVSIDTSQVFAGVGTDIDVLTNLDTSGTDILLTYGGSQFEVSASGGYTTSTNIGWQIKLNGEIGGVWGNVTGSSGTLTVTVPANNSNLTSAFYWLSASSDNFDATGNPTGYGFRYGRKEFHEWSEFKDAESTQAIDLTNFGLVLDNPVDGDRGVSRNLTLSFSVSSNNYETVEAYLFQNTGDFSQLVWKGNAWGNTTSIGPPKLDAATTYNLYIWALKRTFKSDGSDDTFFFSGQRDVFFATGSTITEF